MKKTNKKIFFVVIAAVILGLAGLAYYVYDKSNPKQLTKQDGTKLSQVTTLDSSQATQQSVDTTKLPLGDGKVSSTTPKAGYVYSCTSDFRGGGAQNSGDWISGDTWDETKKIHVLGDVDWPTANVKISQQGTNRIITGNGLPSHNTGVFPISTSDPAYQIDRNPNSIKARTLSVSLQLNPTKASKVGCLNGGPIGYATNGVAIFDALDAAGRDAAAHEVQDNCDGHPEMTGQYHYHNFSSCLRDKKSSQHSDLIGYAIDGFGIFGMYGDNGKQITNDQLDECHGHVGQVNFNGSTTNIYHYHMTLEYPYSIGCYKGTPVKRGPA